MPRKKALSFVNQVEVPAVVKQPDPLPEVEDTIKAAVMRQPETPVLLPPLPSGSAPVLPEPTKRMTADDLRNRMAELCAKHNYDPIAEILRIIEDTKGLLRTEMEVFADNIPVDVTHEQLRRFIRNWAARIPHPEMKEILSLHKELMQYIAPKLKATEVTQVADSSIHVTRKQYSQNV